MDRTTSGRGCSIVLTLWLSLVLVAAGTSLAHNAANAVITTKVFAGVTAPLAASVCLAVRFRSRRLMAAALVVLAFLYLAGSSALLYTVARCPIRATESRVCTAALSYE